MHSRGFTLVELLVVMTISAILIAAAVPSFQWLITTTRASNGANALSGAFELARSESIRRGVVVSVCRTLDPNAPEASLACSNAAGGVYAAGDWASGWVMFEKRGAPPNSAFDNAADVVLFRQQAFGPGNPRLIVASNIANPAVAYDRFGTAASGTPTFSIDYRDPAVVVLSGAARCIGVLPVVGRIQSFRPTAGVCS